MADCIENELNQCICHVLWPGFLPGCPCKLSRIQSRVDVTDGLDCGTQLTSGKPSLPKASRLSSPGSYCLFLEMCKEFVNQEIVYNTCSRLANFSSF